MKNNRILALLSAIVVCTSISLPSFASDSPSIDSELTRIASEIISITVTSDGSGSSKTTYGNIDAFISYAKENTSVTDYDLALFVMEYTGLDYNEYTPECIILESLTFSETTVINEFINFSENANLTSKTPSAITLNDEWISSDGYLKITTTYSKTSATGDTRYVVSATAEWINTPTVQSSDVFVLASNATFDSSYAEFSYIEQREYCVTHNHAVNRYSSATQGNPNGNGITLEYRAGFPGIRFDYFYLCDIDPTAYIFNPDLSVIRAYIRYRVIPTVENGTYSVQASYCHKTFGGQISWSLSRGGLQPSFTIVGTKVDYFARPVTLF